MALTALPPRVAADLRIDDLVNVTSAISASAPAWRVRVTEVATVGGFTYVMARQSGDLIPAAYVFRADQAVTVYRRTA